MAKTLIRPKEAWKRLGLGRTSFEDTFVKTGRLVAVPIGKRSVGFLESEIEGLITELETRRKPPRRARLGKAAA